MYVFVFLCMGVLVCIDYVRFEIIEMLSEFCWFCWIKFGDCSVWWKIVPRWIFLVCLNCICVHQCACIEGITLRK
jgi:hypothetical protein